MTGDIETRLSRVERDVAVLGRAVEDVERDVRVFAPMVSDVATLRERVDGLTQALGGVRDAIGAIRTTLDARDAVASEERRSVRVALIALTGVILAALIAAGGTIIAAGGGP